MIRRSLPLLIILFVGLSSARAEEQKLDLTAWQHIPVFRGGRVMPLDSFARSATEIICDRVNPTIEIDGKRQRFHAPELLLSWLTEPERWEDVPFLIAEHDELREKILGVPVTGPDGTHLKYVSPQTVAGSDAFQRYLAEMGEKQRTARMNGETPAESILDKRAKELFDAFTMYRQITFDPRSTDVRRVRFMQVATDVLGTWSKLEEDLMVLKAKPELKEIIDQTDAALRAVAGAGGNGQFALEAVEPSVIAAGEGLQQLSEACTALKNQIIKSAPKAPGFNAKQMELITSRLNRLAAAMRLIARQGKEMHIAIYENSMDDNRDALRVIPALNAAALEKDRDVQDAAQPWLTLQTVLYGSPELLKAYPQPLVLAVRATFGRLAETYTNRKSSDRDAAVVQAEIEFAEALRNLGTRTSALRDKLAIVGKDEALLGHTAYPPVGETDVEVTYNRVEPFTWSCAISLAACIAFALSFGAVRKPMFWLGALLLAIGLGWTVYGFTLRVMVTHWAPVTNMYETVVYVPFFVSLLGFWFLMLPITWPGLKKAWSTTAIPGTWETGDDGPRSFGLANLVSVVARLALMVLVFRVLTILPYAAGGRTIINLLPVVDEGARLPNLNNFFVWLVGLCVLLPAVWYVPRAMVTFVLSIFTICQSLFSRGGELVGQVYARKPFGLAATFAAFLGAFIAYWSPVLDKNFTPLQPVLRDNFWLTIHVLTIVSSYGAGMLAWGLGNLSLGYYLFGRYRDRSAPASMSVASGYRPAKQDPLTVVAEPSTAKPPEACHSLAGFIYKTMQVAVLLLAAGTILGGLWADVSWGRFWGWDPKEVWALISLLTYLAILHGRYAGWFGDFGLAAGSVLGASAIVFSWYGVNFVLGAGLHSYGFGAGGQAEVAMGVALNWGFLIAAAIRYKLETRGQETPAITNEEADLHTEEPQETAAT